MNKWVFIQPRKVVFNYIFYNFCYICFSDTSVIRRLEYHFSSSIATIFIPFPLFRIVVKIPKFLFYIINLIFYSIFHLFSDNFNLHFNFFILYCILITLKPFLILPITPSSQNVVHMTVLLYPQGMSPSPVMFRMSKCFMIFSSGSYRDSFAVIFCSFKFFVSFPHSAMMFSELVFWVCLLFQVKQVFFPQNIRQQNHWVVFPWSQSLPTQRMVE